MSEKNRPDKFRLPDEASSGPQREYETISFDIVSPRDAASGLPTGKRQHLPVVDGDHKDFVIDGDHKDFVLDGDHKDFVLDGDHKDFVIDDQDLGIVSPRDVASGQATGKRQHEPIQFDDDQKDILGEKWADADGAVEVEDDIVSPRDPASGLPTGQRQHLPVRDDVAPKLVDQDDVAPKLVDHDGFLTEIELPELSFDDDADVAVELDLALPDDGDDGFMAEIDGKSAGFADADDAGLMEEEGIFGADG